MSPAEVELRSRRPSRGWVSVSGAVVAATLATGCAGSAWPEPPSLVRDAADMFSPDVERDAERRLAQIARDHGVWVFVLTHPRPDPPRLLEEPMVEGNEAGVQAVAFVLERGGVASTAANEAARDVHDLLVDAGVGTTLSVALESGTADEALDRFVTRVEGILGDR